MSNVLIGIIGVILFIGLALAGALFLGQRFQEASENTKAAAATTRPVIDRAISDGRVTIAEYDGILAVVRKAGERTEADATAAARRDLVAGAGAGAGDGHATGRPGERYR